MRAYVITIMDLFQSIDVAQRCILSGMRVGVDVHKFPAFTPKDRPHQFFKDAGWPIGRFVKNPFSRHEPCLATFWSHSRLWMDCALDDEPYLILEHDAVFRQPLPVLHLREVDGCCNLGKPSFGNFRKPEPGLGPLVSKRYFPGAHAYYLTPSGAERLLAKAHEAEPTDIFLNRVRFPWLQEFYPWPIVADDSFTTIQKPRGCTSKHNAVEVI